MSRSGDERGAGKSVPSPEGGKVVSYARYLRAREEWRGTDASEEAEGSSPAARADKIRLVRCRIRDGYYDRPEVLEEMIRRLLASLRTERGRNSQRRRR
ncbi:MAG: hypothetical protein FJY88_11265 [Candidatus Eisenbacteria bacterium]|nr:hypothetical protein [Candidatus Eisenbacteria bacterium]